jgi:hypothetical protein
MWLVERDYVIQHVTAYAPHPSSAMPFCQGLGTVVRTALIPLAFIKLRTSVPNLRSRSKMT